MIREVVGLGVKRQDRCRAGGYKGGGVQTMGTVEWGWMVVASTCGARECSLEGNLDVGEAGRQFMIVAMVRWMGCNFLLVLRALSRGESGSGMGGWGTVSVGEKVWAVDNTVIAAPGGWDV